jgi:branched-chain amino acid transport system ATP-binding protein
MSAILEAKGLSKSFGAVIAARDINITVNDGEIVGVIGSNGAGKTTFINMVTGYLKPTTGTITFRGQDITGLLPRQVVRTGVSRSFQVSQLFRELTVLEHMLVAIGMLRAKRLSWLAPLHSEAHDRHAREALARYTIEQHAGSIVSTLPQGVRKLLDIAMAVAAGPRLVLLDEPTSGISVEEKCEIMEVVIGALAATGLTVLFVEHDMEIVERYSERVLAFYDGTVIADGPPAEALHNDKVKRFVVGETLHRSARLAAAQVRA